MNKDFSVEIIIKIPFYDVDSMNIVWHGHYIKYLEDARCALLDKIGYNYLKMFESGYSWPVVNLNVKYVKPFIFGQEIKVKATLIEYENYLKINYLITDLLTEDKLTKAQTTQVAVDMKTKEMCYQSPKYLIDKIQKLNQ